MTTPTLVSGDAIAQDALGHAGKPYVWGGGSPAGWDCSGFANYMICHDMKLAIPDYTGGTFTGSEHGPNVGDWIGWSGVTSISSGSETAGDLICWGPNEHMGIVTGGGKMISALNPQYGTVETTYAGGSPGGTPVFRQLKNTAPGSAGGTGSSDPSGLSAADEASLVSAGCLPGASLIAWVYCE